MTELTGTREIEERLHGGDGVGDAHTHTLVARDNGGGLPQRVETRCGQLGVLPREQRETLCPLEAGPVLPREFEGTSAVDGCTRSLGGIEAPGALVVARVPVVIVPRVNVPVCVYTSVLKCVLQRTHSTSVRACAKAPSCMEETPCLDETPSETPCVPEPSCVRATPCATEAPSVDETPCARETPSASETPCASGGVTSVPECVLPGTPCVKGATAGGRNRVCARNGTCVRTPLCGRDTAG